MPYVKGICGAVPEDLTGRTFGRLSVVRQDMNATRRPRWICLCQCGAIKSVEACELKSGKTKSCGCLNRQNIRAAKKHGLAKTSTYRVWANMIARCSNPKRPDFSRYGGRGISVCDRWRDFSNFVADMGERPESLTLDRIDNNGNYEPENCRWATMSQQRRNQRTRSEIRAAAEIARAADAGGKEGHE